MFRLYYICNSVQLFLCIGISARSSGLSKYNGFLDVPTNQCYSRCSRIANEGCPCHAEEASESELRTVQNLFWLMINVGTTIINFPQITIDSWYKPFPNGFIIVISTLVVVDYTTYPFISWRLH